MPWSSQSDRPDADRVSDDKYAIYSKVHHRLALLDSPDPNGWTIKELADEYGCSPSWMANVMRRLISNGQALITDEGRYIGA